jgi:hypothetical protein
MLLAFAGKQRSGKDTAVKIAMEVANRPVSLHIAEGIYRVAKLMLNKLIIDNTDPKIRKLLQDIGSAGRNYYEDFWVKNLVDDINDAKIQGYEDIFITGIRYPNEIAKLRELGFRVIYVSRNIGSRLDEGASHTNHHSETSISSSDFDEKDIIYNNGTLEEFKATLLARL